MIVPCTPPLSANTFGFAAEAFTITTSARLRIPPTTIALTTPATLVETRRRVEDAKGYACCGCAKITDVRWPLVAVTLLCLSLPAVSSAVTLASAVLGRSARAGLLRDRDPSPEYAPDSTPVQREARASSDRQGSRRSRFCLSECDRSSRARTPQSGFLRRQSAGRARRRSHLVSQLDPRDVHDQRDRSAMLECEPPRLHDHEAVLPRLLSYSFLDALGPRRPSMKRAPKKVVAGTDKVNEASHAGSSTRAAGNVRTVGGITAPVSEPIWLEHRGRTCSQCVESSVRRRVVPRRWRRLGSGWFR